MIHERSLGLAAGLIATLAAGCSSSGSGLSGSGISTSEPTALGSAPSTNAPASSGSGASSSSTGSASSAAIDQGTPLIDLPFQLALTWDVIFSTQRVRSSRIWLTADSNYNHPQTVCDWELRDFHCVQLPKEIPGGTPSALAAPRNATPHLYAYASEPNQGTFTLKSELLTKDIDFLGTTHSDGSLTLRGDNKTALFRYSGQGAAAKREKLDLPTNLETLQLVGEAAMYIQKGDTDHKLHVRHVSMGKKSVGPDVILESLPFRPDATFTSGCTEAGVTLAWLSAYDSDAKRLRGAVVYHTEQASKGPFYFETTGGKELNAFSYRFQHLACDGNTLAWAGISDGKVFRLQCSVEGCTMNATKPFLKAESSDALVQAAPLGDQVVLVEGSTFLEGERKLNALQIRIAPLDKLAETKPRLLVRESTDEKELRINRISLFGGDTQMLLTLHLSRPSGVAAFSIAANGKVQPL